MSHETLMVVGNFDSIYHYVDSRFDYFTEFDELSDDQKYKGLVLKDGVKNDTVYTYEGKQYASCAKVEDVDWKKTKKANGISMYIDNRTCVEDFDFYSDSKKQVDNEAFWEFILNKINFNQGEEVKLVDIHC